MEIETLANSMKGLSNEEVKIRQEKYGLNVLPEKKPPSKLTLFLSQLKNPLVYVLLGAALVTFAIGHGSDAVIILFAVTIIPYLVLYRKIKPQKHFQHLRSLSPINQSFIEMELEKI